jgi:hypothetical protein
MSQKKNQKKKKYEDMTPEEQFEYRTTDSSGIMFNGVMYTKEELDAIADAPSEAVPPDGEPAKRGN